MNKKIRAVVETSESFTLEQLKSLQETGAGLPIHWGFDCREPMGVVDKIELIDDKELVVYGTITRDKTMGYLDRFYLTIGYILQGHEMTSYGVVKNPMNKELPLIELLTKPSIV